MDEEKKTTTAESTAQTAAESSADTAQTAEAPAAETVETATAAAAEETAEKTGKKDKKEKKEKADPVKTELDAAKAELSKTKDLFLRTAAEYDNYRKRTTRERDAAFGNGVAHAAEKLLPLVDTLEIAAGADSIDENYKKGVLMTLEKAHAALKDLGLEEIPTQDQTFDPQLHSAMMQQAVEGVEPGRIVQVFQKGYTLNGKVVRHAMVVVSA